MEDLFWSEGNLQLFSTPSWNTADFQFKFVEPVDLVELNKILKIR